jgi:hypothetical protein
MDPMTIIAALWNGIKFEGARTTQSTHQGVERREHTSFAITVNPSAFLSNGTANPPATWSVLPSGIMNQ